MNKVFNTIAGVLAAASSSLFVPAAINFNPSDTTQIVIAQETNRNEYYNSNVRIIDIMNTVISNEVKEWHQILVKLSKNDIDDEHGYFNYINEIRRSDNYSELLKYSLGIGEKYAISALLMFLSQKDKKFITAEEEDFVISILEGNDLVLQEDALNTILAWDSISQIDRLRNIKIKNYYLQLDLEMFLEEC